MVRRFSLTLISCLLALFTVFFTVSCASSTGSRSASADTTADGHAAGAFPDIEPNSWYARTVLEMTQAGWLIGYPDGTFKPLNMITASEFVTIAARCANLSPAASAQTSGWAAKTMQAALDAGWYDWDEIPPTGEKYEQPLSRQLAVKILMKAILPDARGDYHTESKKIRDFSELDGRYYETVLAAYASGIVQGDDLGNFKPKSSLSRAETCALIQRAVAKMNGNSKTQDNLGSFGNSNSQNGQNSGSQSSLPPSAPSVSAVQGGVSHNGWLQVNGTQLCNEQGIPVFLHGMSTHGIQWYGQYASAGAIQATALYGANLFRVAMYTAEGGYLSNPAAIKQQTIAAVDAAVENDMYVIIDWHILSDGNPMSHIDEAVAFFAEMAQRYKNSPAVLFEICNEPNGNISWAADIKPYARQIIDTIRAFAPRSIILIGSGTWSQDIHTAATDPLSGTNLMYTCHFYAGTHGQFLRDRIDSALSAGLPIFVSEWGTSSADGSGGVFLDESKVWLDFLDSRKISWANWSLCDKNETSAALRPGTSSSGPWTQDDLSVSGKFVFSRFFTGK